MPNIKKTIQLYRNENLIVPDTRQNLTAYEVAVAALDEMTPLDGEIVCLRYQEENDSVKTLIAVYNSEFNSLDNGWTILEPIDIGNYYTKDEVDDGNFVIAQALSHLNEEITNFEETDPVFSASPAAGITTEDINKWDGKQDALTFDNAPTDNSTNMVRSGGIKAYVDNMNAGLATVATSGSYNDLTNKPTIPDAQIQSDWLQSDNTAKDFIKNKPTVTNGKSAYQSYLDTTSDNPVKSESEWIASLKGDSGVSLGEISLVQTTGTSDISVMSQAAVTDAINDNVTTERGTCIKFGATAYTKLNSRQISLLNSSNVMSMTFMVSGGDIADGSGGTQDWRYIRIGTYSSDSDVLSFGTTFWGAFYKIGFTQNNQAATITPSFSYSNTPHPVVCTIVCDRERGVIKFYRGSSLASTDTRNEYKVNKFVGDDGLMIFSGGDNGCRFYGLQIYDFDITRGEYLKESLDNAETSAVDVFMKTYNLSHDFVNQNTSIYQSSYYTITTSNNETTITRNDGLAGNFFFTNFVSDRCCNELVTEFTIDKSFTIDGWDRGRTIYDSSGNLVYEGMSTTTVIPAGTYKMISFWEKYAVGIRTTEAGATLVIHSNKVREVGCIAHFKFDTLYNRRVYDDVANRFYSFYSNTTCTTVTDNYSISNLPLRTPFLGNLTVPHYIGEIKIYSGNIYIADNTWTWKRINNT